MLNSQGKQEREVRDANSLQPFDSKDLWVKKSEFESIAV